MVRAILTCAGVLTGLACAGRPQVELPASVDGLELESLEAAGRLVRPRILNQDEVNRALHREYPVDLKNRGVGGTTGVDVLVDEEGIVRNQRVSRRSGYREIDDAALRVARIARFSPATNEGEKVAVWVSLDFTFRAR